MKINTYLDFQGNEIKLATPEKVTTLPDSNLFIGRTCILISEKEVDETTISVGSVYYYNGEQWCHIEVEPLKIDETKINVIDDEITLHKFDTLADAVTYIKSNNKPKSVIIGSNAGVTAIGASAFYGCTSLTSVTIPSSVTSIGSSAFRDCTALTYITIPDTVTSIGTSAFSSCTSLKSITIPSSITSISNYAFAGCTSLKSITIPSSVTSIGSNAFTGCTSLTSINISNNITSISQSTFSGCTSLKSITMPSGVTSIGNAAFQNCTSLESITNYSNVTSIGNEAFRNCTSLTSFYIPSGVTSIGSSAFRDCTSLTSVTIPSSVTSIGSNAFTGCDILILNNYKSRTGYPWGAANIYIQNEDVTTTINASSTDRQVPTAKAVYDALPSLDDTKINVMCEGDPELYTFTTLADTKTFINSTNVLKHVIIGSNAGITSIGNSAFQSCKSLTSVTIPSSVTSIGNYAFNDCASLTSITIPSGVTSISDYAFQSCKSLTSITIPSSVTSIGAYAFAYCESITYIGIPENVTSIGDHAFAYCESITSMSIPYNVTSIGNSTFEGCKSLEAIDLSYDITSIGNYAFSGCKSLEYIDIPGITDIMSGTFYNCTSLTSITIPDTVTSIGTSAFAGCTSLTSITIPDTVTSIANNAFTGCDILLLNAYKSKTGYPWGAADIYIQNEDVTTTINASSTDREVPTAKTVYDALSPYSLDDTKINVIDDEVIVHKFDTLADAATYIKSNNKPKSVVIGSNAGVTVIGENEFKDCTSLTSITIPSGVTSIGNYAFQNCTSLTSITIPSSVTSIGNKVFRSCTSLTSVTIPDSVTSIGDDAFNDCASLTSITIPSGVTSIGNYTFYGCTSLKSITIPSGVTRIGTSAFYNCTSLTSITIPSGVTSIGVGVFWNCTSLKSITIPSGVTSIGNAAFQNCTSLISITIPDTVISIANNAFTGCDILSLDAYKSRTGYPWGATNILIQNEDVTTTIDISSTDRQVPTAKAVYDAISSYSLDETKINVMCEGDPKLYTFTTLANTATFINSTDVLKHVIIGSNAGITSIGFETFWNCTSLKSITIPSSVTSISDYAFCACTSLVSINIPSSVASIGDGAFADCTSLTSITIPNGITSISGEAFADCTSLTSITIPDSVTSINYYAFKGCTSLTSITIPNDVTSIGYGAFKDCTSLTSITIPNGASIDSIAFNDCTSLKSITIPYMVTNIASDAFTGCDILSLDTYKSREGYPWGATDIYIQNEDVTTTIDENSTDRQVPTAKAVQAPVARLVNAGAKNKLNHTAYTRTVNGVTYTVNTDRSITITSNGTNTQSLLYLTQNAPLAAGSYILSGCTGGSTTKYDLRVKVGNTITNNYDDGTAFTADGTPIEVSIVVRASQTLNVTIKPMICTTADYAISPSYVQYAPSNRELYEEVESKASLEDILGIGTTITSNADMNNLTDIGKWYCVNASTAVTVTNAPFTDAAYFGWTTRSIASSDRYVQIAIKNSDDFVIAKRRYSGVWSAWSYITGTAVT